MNYHKHKWTDIESETEFECIEIVNSQIQTLQGIRFIDCVFNSCDLSNCDIEHASFQNVIFRDCKMIGLRFNTCDSILFSAEFQNCNLNHSIMSQMNLKQTLFRDCSLQRVDFTGTDLTEASLLNCDLEGTFFENTILNKAILSGSTHLVLDPEFNQVKNMKIEAAQLPGLLLKYQLNIQ